MNVTGWMARATTAAGVLVVGAGVWTAGAQELPDSMIWSSYDVGSSGYVEASAVADAFMNDYGTRIRLLPSGTSIGRIGPLKQGRATHAWLSSEAYFAAEGLFDFGTRDWGPQDLRALVGRQSAYGIAVAETGGVETVADLAGKRIAYVAANPSVNLKNDAILAAAGLTRDDVEAVEYPGYAPALRALLDGEVDAAGGITTSAVFFEIESSDRGLKWLELDPENDVLWDAVEAVVPTLAPFQETIGAGVDPSAPVNLMSFRNPIVTVYADYSDEDAYNFTKAFHQEFDDFKDASPVMALWDLDKSSSIPIDVPFHPGAVRYFKEAGMWSDEKEAWNQSRIEELAALQTAWGTALEQGGDLDDDAFATLWQDLRDGG